MSDTTWTPQKQDKAWRIVDRALEVIAEGVGVPVGELRAFLFDGWKPPAIEPAARIHGARKAPEDIEAALSKISDTQRLMLRSGSDYLHMSCATTTTERKLAWQGTKNQLRKVREKYPLTKRMEIALVVPPPVLTGSRANAG